MFSRLTDVMKVVEEYSKYLESEGIPLDEQSFPVLHPECFLDTWPEAVVPFQNRNSTLVADPSKTVICFYCPDERIYPRLDKVFKEIPEYQRFMGVVATDVTVTQDMDPEWQFEIMLLNQLFMGVLAVKGIKVIPNLRCGLQETLFCFESIPPGVMCASGTLGCSNLKRPHDMSYLEKVMKVRPSKILIYGKPDPIMESQLNTVGIPYRRFDDVHRATKKERTS
ncbi:DUF4417 domain-containing protein [Atopobium deltae]|nr:DUF4417 domain-containing protein [Atopobium deltae]